MKNKGGDLVSSFSYFYILLTHMLWYNKPVIAFLLRSGVINMLDTNNAKLNFSGDVGYITFPILEQFDFVRHAFSTKLGGVSSNEFSSMNLSFNRGDSEENVIENYHRLCEAIGVGFDTLVASSQDHHTNIRVVGQKDRGVGIWKKQDMQSVDGLVTNEKGVTLVTYYADCTPIYFLDPEKKVIGLAHAGWRGTVGQICSNMIEKMITEYGCNTKNIICVIGPAIGPCCYEVDEPVYGEFAMLSHLDPEKFTSPKGDNKYMIDLWETNKRILLDAGVREKNIVISGVCTKCNSDILFSHRATNGKRGGMVAIMSLQ